MADPELALRETFIFDLEHILKVLTFKEVITYVLPCLDVYIIGEDFLKIELCRQLPQLFTKIMKYKQLSTDKLIDLLVEKVFPLVSQILMISEESVQQEAVKSLLQVCCDGVVEMKDSVLLMQNVYQILIDKKDKENSLVGALVMLEAFTKENIFGEEIVQKFIKNGLSSICYDKFQKTKKPLIQCLISISKHLTKE